MMKILLLALGGATGTVARYGAVSIMSRFFPGLPYGTLLVNLVGSLAIGLLWGLMGDHVSQNVRLFLFVGLLGGFTTFSAFSMDTVDLFRDGMGKIAVGYVLTSTIGGILLAWGGYAVGNALR